MWIPWHHAAALSVLQLTQDAVSTILCLGWSHACKWGINVTFAGANAHHFDGAWISKMQFVRSKEHVNASHSGEWKNMLFIALPLRRILDVWHGYQTREKLLARVNKRLTSRQSQTNTDVWHLHHWRMRASFGVRGEVMRVSWVQARVKAAAKGVMAARGSRHRDTNMSKTT